MVGGKNGHITFSNLNVFRKFTLQKKETFMGSNTSENHGRGITSENDISGN